MRQSPEETVELVKLVSQERVQQRDRRGAVDEEFLPGAHLGAYTDRPMCQCRRFWESWSPRERVQQRTSETVAVVELVPRERVQQRSAERIEAQERVQQRTVDAPRPQDKNVLPKRFSDRISEQSGAIEVPETAGQDRHWQRAVRWTRTSSWSRFLRGCRTNSVGNI